MSINIYFEDLLIEYSEILNNLKKFIKKINYNVKNNIDIKLNENSFLEIFDKKFKNLNDKIIEVNEKNLFLKNFCKNKSQIFLYKEKVEFNEIIKSYFVRLYDHLIFLMNKNFDLKLTEELINNEKEFSENIFNFINLIKNIKKKFIGSYWSIDYYRGLIKSKLRKKHESIIEIEIEKIDLNGNIKSEDNISSKRNSNFSIETKPSVVNKSNFILFLLIFLNISFIILIILFLKRFN